MSNTLDSMRYIRDNHHAQVVCQACGARAPIPDSYYHRDGWDDVAGEDEDCDPCPECREPALTIVDATTAHAVLTVHDGLSASNKIKFADLPFMKMVEVTWKIWRR